MRDEERTERVGREERREEGTRGESRSTEVTSTSRVAVKEEQATKREQR